MATPNNPYEVLADDVDVDVESGSGKEVEFFHFKNLALDAKVMVPGAPEKDEDTMLKMGTSLFDCSSEYGYFVAGTLKGFILAETKKLRSQLKATKRGESSVLSDYISIHIDESEVAILCLSADQCQVFVGLSNGLLCFYNIQDIVKHKEKAAPNLVRRFDKKVTCIRPNRAAHTSIIAVCTEDNECHLVEYVEQKEVASISNIFDMSWSPDGQQLVCGMTTGRLSIVDMNGTSKEEILPPASMDGYYVNAVQWIDDSTFFTIYAKANNPDNEAFEYIHMPYIISRNASNDNEKYTLLAEINPAFDHTIPEERFYLPVIHNLGEDIKNLVVSYDAATTEISFIGQDKDGQWATWLFETPPCLPVAVDGYTDTYPVGAAVDFSAFEDDSDTSDPAMPIVYHLTTEGAICAHYLYNEKMVSQGQRYSGIIEAKDIQDIPLVKNTASQPLQAPTPMSTFAEAKHLNSFASSPFTSTATPASAFATAAASPQSAFQTPKDEQPSQEASKANPFLFTAANMGTSTSSSSSFASSAPKMGAFGVPSGSSIKSNSPMPTFNSTPFGTASAPTSAFSTGAEHAESTVGRETVGDSASDDGTAREEPLPGNINNEKDSGSDITQGNDESSKNTDDSVVVLDKPRSQSSSGSSDGVRTMGETEDEEGDHTSVEFSSSDKVFYNNKTNNELEDDESQENAAKDVNIESNLKDDLKTATEGRSKEDVGLNDNEKSAAISTTTSDESSAQGASGSAAKTKEDEPELTEEQKQIVEEEKRIIEDFKRRAEEEEQKAQIEREKADEARKKAEQIRRKAEEEIQQVREERRKAEEACRQAEENRIRAEKERQAEEDKLEQEKQRVREREIEEKRKKDEESLQFVKRDIQKVTAAEIKKPERTPGLTGIAQVFEDTCIETMEAVFETSKLIKDNDDEITLQSNDSLARKDLSYFKKCGFKWKLSDMEDIAYMTNNLHRQCDDTTECLNTLTKGLSVLTNNMNRVTKMKDAISIALDTDSKSSFTDTIAKNHDSIEASLSEALQLLIAEVDRVENLIKKMKKKLIVDIKRRSINSQLSAHELQRTVRDIERSLDKAQVKLEALVKKDIKGSRAENKLPDTKDECKDKHLENKSVTVQSRIDARSIFLNAIATMN